MARKQRSILSSLISLELADKTDKKLIHVFSKLFSRLKNPNDFLELFYALVDLGSEKFARVLSYLNAKIQKHIKQLGMEKLRVLLLYTSQTCPRCLKMFLDRFGEDISGVIDRMHFNDIVILAINISLLNEDCGQWFVEAMKDTIRRLARTEGFNHFGTVIWYMATLRQYRLARLFIDILSDIFLQKCRSISEIGDFLFWLSRGSEEIGDYAFEVVKKHIFDLMETSTIQEIARFLVVIKKHDGMAKRVMREVAPRIRGRLKTKEEAERLRNILNYFRIDVEELNF